MINWKDKSVKSNKIKTKDNRNNIKYNYLIYEYNSLKNYKRNETNSVDGANGELLY